MRKLVYYVGTSLDGIIAGPSGETDFYPVTDEFLAFLTAEYPETLPTHVRTQLGIDAPNRRFDTVVMGRGTYQPALDIDITSPYRHLRQYVVSRTIPQIDDPQVELVTNDPVDLVHRLKKEDGLDIWLCGGGKLAGTLLPEIDELVVKLYPIVTGVGVRIVDGAFNPNRFTLTDRRFFDDGPVVLTYART
ncbi:Dihydrofolate reductase [Micromonospora pattaloongensis]|uniref:Dihydrofolate reductase n=1 Tax=Micromonospora pattaloongensis TaxID=405436 RepID=A0A1H3KBM5_9ACTN|nr:dihydrofolate reductase family protein [Micromonospora pattaloongensis]SDY49566.1 Dihydrofolate reductase [Micromonospora pattaloongensis]